MAVLSQMNSETLKHLEFIQAVIARQASNSFLIKGWAITVSSAIYGFAISGASWGIALVGLLPALMFWGLDGYFIWQERRYRCLYDAVRSNKLPPDAQFSMDPTPYSQNAEWPGSVLSRTLGPLYGLIMVVGVILVVVEAAHHS
jgi:hypothetical protein